MSVMGMIYGGSEYVLLIAMIALFAVVDIVIVVSVVCRIFGRKHKNTGHKDIRDVEASHLCKKGSHSSWDDRDPWDD